MRYVRHEECFKDDECRVYVGNSLFPLRKEEGVLKSPRMVIMCGDDMKYDFDTSDWEEEAIKKLYNFCRTHTATQVLTMFEWCDAYDDCWENAICMSNMIGYTGYDTEEELLMDVVSSGHFGEVDSPIYASIDYEMLKEEIDGTLYDMDAYGDVHEYGGFYFESMNGCFYCMA